MQIVIDIDENLYTRLFDSWAKPHNIRMMEEKE